MNSKTARFLIVAALIFSAVEAQAGNKFTRYLKDRRNNLADIFRFRIEIPERSESIAVKVRATSLFQAGGVRFIGEAIGMDRRAMGVIEEERMEFGASLFYYSSVRNSVVKGNQFTDIDSDWSQRAPRHLVRDYKGWDDGRYRYLSCGLELQLFSLPGLDVGIYPEEIGDFALGFLGIDQFHDDLAKIKKRSDRDFEESHTQAIRDEKDFVFNRSYDDDLAPYEYKSDPPPAKSR